MVFEALNEPDARPRALRRIAGGAAALGLTATLGVLLALHWAQGEQERELRAWQLRLGVVADSRAAALGDWLEAQHGSLRELADNAALQLYLTDLAFGGGADQDPPEAQYLRNLLAAVAARAGFSAPPGRETPANVARTGLAGLALADASGRPLVATPGMPPLAGKLRRLIDETPKGERGLLDLHLGPDDRPAIGFLSPIFAVQGDDLVGYVIGLKPVGDEFYARLAQPGETAASAETVLARSAGDAVEYLSPLADGTPPLRRRLARSTQRLAAAALVERPGGFGAFVDYAGREVLATSRAVPGAPWTLMRMIGRDEALGEANRRLAATLAVLLLAIAGAAVAIVAVWRHGASLRASELAERFRSAKERNEAMADFLRLVTDGQPTAIAAVDAEGAVTFANRRAAAMAGIEPADALGKSLASLLGPARARPYEEGNRRAAREGRRITETHDAAEADGRRVLKTEHIPLPDGAGRAGALMIVDDVTELVTERERRERILRDLVRTLVAVVDRRDPYSAHHSERVAEVARTVAAEMGLTAAEIDTVEIAGSLMNLGKIAVPSALLTKAGPLSEAELKLIRESILTSANLVENVAFDGPVAETIRQMQERWDGAGPRGLAGETILPTARVLAAANAFVGMVSARAWRPGMALDAAATAMLREAGQAFDRRVVAALVNVLDSRGGRQRWAQYGAAPAAV